MTTEQRRPEAANLLPYEFATKFATANLAVVDTNLARLPLPSLEPVFPLLPNPCHGVPKRSRAVSPLPFLWLKAHSSKLVLASEWLTAES